MPDYTPYEYSVPPGYYVSGDTGEFLPLSPYAPRGPAGETLGGPASTFAPLGGQTQQLLDVLAKGAGNVATGDALRQLLGELGLASVAPRATTISEGLLASQRLAAGSPQEILTQFNEQINQIQQQLQQQSQSIARQGGPFFGGQRQRAQGAAVGQAATQLQGLFGQAATGGQRALLQFASGINPLTAVGVGGQSVSQQPVGPELFNQLGGAAVDITSQLQRLFAGTGGGAALAAPYAPAQLPLSTAPTLGAGFGALGAAPAISYTPPPNIYGYGAP